MAKTVKLTKELAEKIRIEFVQGIDLGTSQRKYQTIDALAIKYKVARSTLYKWSQKESWKNQQERFHSQYMEELDAERRKGLVQESKSLDKTCLSLAKIIINEIGMQFQENNLARQTNGEKFTPQYINQLSSASLQAQKLAKLALGESTENMSLNAEVSETEAFRRAMELLDEVQEYRTKDIRSAH